MGNLTRKVKLIITIKVISGFCHEDDYVLYYNFNYLTYEHKLNLMFNSILLMFLYLALNIILLNYYYVKQNSFHYIVPILSYI